MPSPLQAFDCLYRQMLRDNGRGKAIALLFAAAQLLCLANFGLGALLTAMLKKSVFSTRSTVFDAWCGENLIRCATQIFLHSHGQFLQRR